MIEIEDADVFKLLFWRRLVSAGRLHHLALKVIYLTTHLTSNAMQCLEIVEISPQFALKVIFPSVQKQPSSSLEFIHSFTKSLSSSSLIWFSNEKECSQRDTICQQAGGTSCDKISLDWPHYTGTTLSTSKEQTNLILITLQHAFK